MKIFIATHKKAPYPENDIYVPIQVGAYNKEKFTEVTDNTGENISEKNKNYCELTATYWILKNDTSDIVGLTHYRRYFFLKPSSDLKDVLKEDDIRSLLNEYDMIVPQKTHLVKYKNIKEAYASLHKEEDWLLCKKIILEKYPEYVESFEKVEKQKSFYACNMFISTKKYFDAYYSWLFDILFELEKRVNISNYDSYNQRIFGFLSERLFNVWLCKNELKIKEIPVYNIDQNIRKQQIEYRIKNTFLR